MEEQGYDLRRLLLAVFLTAILSVGITSICYLHVFQAPLPAIPAVQEPIFEVCFLEIRYVIHDEDDINLRLEVIDKVWINGAPDWNSRPFKFRRGETVTVECPENILGAHFAFWQRQEPEPTFQGLIVANRTLTITLDDSKTMWWANYRGDLSSLARRHP